MRNSVGLGLSSKVVTKTDHLGCDGVPRLGTMTDHRMIPADLYVLHPRVKDREWDVFPSKYNLAAVVWNPLATKWP